MTAHLFDDWFNRAMIDVVRLKPGANDADRIAHVHRVSRAWYYGTDTDPSDGREVMWSELLAQPGRITCIAESAGGVVGFMSAIRVAKAENTLELSALYVLPERFGVGIGARLHEQFDAERGKNEEGVLEVWKGNARAIAFYLKRGWVPTTTTRPGPGDLDYVTYRLPAKCAST